MNITITGQDYKAEKNIFGGIKKEAGSKIEIRDIPDDRADEALGQLKNALQNQNQLKSSDS